ncbi:MAG: pyridoxamine 5'-phosphate oxidase family protein [Bacteroidota bacterium]
MPITTEDQLRALYGHPKDRTVKKVMPSLDEHARNFLQLSPFCTMSTVNAAGQLDVSPRGGQPGFVHIQDARTLLLPDAKGNNRLDSLTNILATGRVGTLFLLPGVDETLRINGTAVISNEAAVLEPFAADRHAPKTCIVITVEEVFLHCAKALMRSHLWDPEAQIDRADFPTMGQMLKDQLGHSDPPESQQDMLKRYAKDI